LADARAAHDAAGVQAALHKKASDAHRAALEHVRSFSHAALSSSDAPDTDDPELWENARDSFSTPPPPTSRPLAEAYTA
jgi:hypothetical protein